MAKRKIIEINPKKCNGCGLCIPDCPEGALQMIDGKARLISDLFCDGLGACIGSCPQDAIRVIEREAKPYDEEKVMKNIVKQGTNTIKAHLKHLEDHNETKFLKQAKAYLKAKNIKIDPVKKEKSAPLPCGCPGTAMREIKAPADSLADTPAKISSKKIGDKSGTNAVKQKSELRQWPVQLALLPPQASFFNNSDLLVAADCVAYANPNFHSELLKGKSVVIGCPKLDDLDSYEEKFVDIFKMNKVKSVTVAIMEVPCCGGLASAVESAIRKSGKKIPLKVEVISVNGEKMGMR